MPKSGETSKTKCARHYASHEFVIAASALQHMLKGGCHRPTMSDANECLVGITLSNTSHQLAFSMLIKRGTYFIQQQDTARTKQSSGTTPTSVCWHAMRYSSRHCRAVSCTVATGSHPMDIRSSCTRTLKMSVVCINIHSGLYNIHANVIVFSHICKQ